MFCRLIRTLIYSIVLISIPVSAIDRELIFRKSSDDYIIQIPDKGLINWSQSYIESSASVDLPEIIFDVDHPDFGKAGNVKNISNARSQAHDIAYEIAAEKLLNILGGVRLDSRYTLIEKLYNDRELRYRMGDIKDRFIIKSRRTGEGIVSIELALQFYTENGLFAVIADQKVGSEMIPALENNISDEVSGLIVNLTGFDEFQPSLEPSIFSNLGRRIYGPQQSSRDCAINNGIVKYVTSYEKAESSRNVGSKPYYMYAAGLTGTNKSDIFINADDTARLLSSKSARKAMNSCKVTFIVRKKNS